MSENAKSNAKNGGKWDFIAKIRNWQQVVATIVAIPITAIFGAIKPETAPYTTTVSLALVFLAIYIVRISNKETTNAEYLRGAIKSQHEIMKEIRKEKHAATTPDRRDALEQLFSKLDFREEALKEAYENLAGHRKNEK